MQLFMVALYGLENQNTVLPLCCFSFNYKTIYLNKINIKFDLKLQFAYPNPKHNFSQLPKIFK